MRIDLDALYRVARALEDQSDDPDPDVPVGAVMAKLLGLAPSEELDWMFERETRRVLELSEGHYARAGVVKQPFSVAMLGLLQGVTLAAAVQRVKATTGADLIAAERERQIAQERWTPEHDDAHADGELAAAAVCYAAPESIRNVIGVGGIWPFEDEMWKPSLHSDRVRELVKAGALIAAEIDRLERT